MNPTAIYSKSGKGVQEAAGKTSLLQRPDRAVLSAIDGRATLADVAQKVGKTFDAAFQAVITKLDKDGFIREVSAGAAGAAPKPAAAAPKPAAKPAAKGEPAGGDLDFSSLGIPSRPAPKPAAPAPKPAAAAPKVADALDFSSLSTPSKPVAAPDQSALIKAREEAEAKAQADRDRVKKEAEAKARAEIEAKMHVEAEKKQKEEAEAKAKAEAAAKAEAEAKIKAAREAALRAAEAKLKAEQEAKAKLEAERKAREEMEKRLEAERKAREEAERARLEAERKAKEEAERARKEAEEKARREAEELRQRLEQERQAREAAERKAKEEAERARKELEEERKRLEAERKRMEAEATRRAQEDAARAEQEEAARAAKRKLAEEQASMAAAAARPASASKEAKKDSFADSLLQDLDNFTSKDEEDAKAHEAAERKAKAEAEQRAREDTQRQAQEEAERLAREAEEARRREEEARRAREEQERRAQEDERRRREAEEIRRKAEAATAAAMAKEGKKPPEPSLPDIPVTDDDLDMDEVKKERAALEKSGASEIEREREREKEKEKAEKKRKKEKDRAAEAAPLPRVRRPSKLGRPIAMTLALLLVLAIGVAHVMPLNTADYERVATEALGRPVRIGSAHLWLITGLQVRFTNVAVGDAKIAHVAGHPSMGSMFGDRKDFNKIELDGLTLPQQAIGDAIFAKVRSDGFSVEQIVIKNLEVPGPATLPKSLQADIALDARGAVKSATLRGPDGLVARIAPRGEGVSFEVTAAGFTLPIAPQVTLSNFGMKGSATPRGMTVSEWGGSLLGGAMNGTANVRWGGNWNVEGVITVRNINAAVFAPALLSSGIAEGTGKFSMNAPDPAGLVSASRIDGNFTVNKGTLGSFDLAQAIQSAGKTYRGTTPFVEMNGQASYNRGAVSLRNVTIGAGALNAGASADIAESGALTGRIVADVRTANRSLSATLLLGGTVKEPQVRN